MPGSCTARTRSARPGCGTTPRSGCSPRRPVEHAGWQPWQVLGGPGTGKTSLLVDLAVARIAGGRGPGVGAGADAFKRAAGPPCAKRSPRACSPRHGPRRHSRTARAHRPLLRLRGAAPAGGRPRQPAAAADDRRRAGRRACARCCAGDIADGGHAVARAAARRAGMAGFAVELRDFMLRVGERGLGPEDLVELGREHDRPEWVAAGQVRHPVRAGDAAARCGRGGGARGQRARPRRRRTRRRGPDCLRDRPGPARPRTRPRAAPARRRRPAPRPAGRRPRPAARHRHGAHRRRRRPGPGDLRLPRCRPDLPHRRRGHGRCRIAAPDRARHQPPQRRRARRSRQPGSLPACPVSARTAARARHPAPRMARSASRCCASAASEAALVADTPAPRSPRATGCRGRRWRC